MPSAMIHILTAYKYNKNASALFFIGNVAPDAIDERELKDMAHFRNINNESRLQALIDLKNSIDKNNEYCIGALMHLYIDYLWDNYVFDNYKETSTDADWFKLYRNEILYDSVYLYHHLSFAKDLWFDMLSYPKEEYDYFTDYDCNTVNAYLKRLYSIHTQNDYPPSEVFPIDFIEEFTFGACKAFNNFMTNY